jgi:electron transfer flavoprotein beta subunit
MKICVLVRQVPSGNNGNPFDLHAVEEAVLIRKHFCAEAEITVISMGPPAAARVLYSALALGCDNAYLLSDPAFGGGDAGSTSYALYKGIEAVGEFDVILCGDGSDAGRSGQVGPGVAAYFDMPVIAGVSCIEGLADGWIVARRSIEGGQEMVEASLPILLTLGSETGGPRLPVPETDPCAARAAIHTLEAEDIGVEAGRIGLRNALTSLAKVFYTGAVMSRRRLPARERN